MSEVNVLFKGENFYNLERQQYQAEEYECAMKYLDQLGVPRSNGQNTYSLVGRIDFLRRPNDGYFLRKPNDG